MTVLTDFYNAEIVMEISSDYSLKDIEKLVMNGKNMYTYIIIMIDILHWDTKNEYNYN